MLEWHKLLKCSPVINWDGILGKGKALTCAVYEKIKKYLRISNYKGYGTRWMLLWAINSLKIEIK